MFLTFVMKPSIKSVDSVDSIDKIFDDTISENECANASHEIQSVTSNIASFNEDNISEKSFAIATNEREFNPNQEEIEATQNGYLETDGDFDNDEAEGEIICEKILSDVLNQVNY